MAAPGASGHIGRERDCCASAPGLTPGARCSASCGRASARFAALGLPLRRPGLSLSLSAAAGPGLAVVVRVVLVLRLLVSVFLPSCGRVDKLRWLWWVVECPAIAAVVVVGGARPRGMWVEW